jgi:hypothetical protein
VSHRNARTTFHGRPLMVRRYQAGWAKAHIAEAMGISRKCVHTWIGVRFVDQSNRNLAYSVPRVSKPGSTCVTNAEGSVIGELLKAVLCRR